MLTKGAWEFGPVTPARALEKGTEDETSLFSVSRGFFSFFLFCSQGGERRHEKNKMKQERKEERNRKRKARGKGSEKKEGREKSMEESMAYLLLVVLQVDS